MKNALRAAEAILEVALLSLLFYIIWRNWYGESPFPPYYGRGKIVLMGTYATICFVSFHLCDSFKFGYLKMVDVMISQWISVFIVNFITYFQLCLIANVMISPVPMIVLTLIDLTVTSLCSYLFTGLYHRFYVPRNMLLVYGTENSVELKFKMDNRSDKYHITEIISAKETFENICAAIKRHDAVIINDVPSGLRNDLVKYCYGNRIRTYTVPKISDNIMAGSKEISLFDTPLRLIKGRGLSLPQRFVKRIMDISLSLIAMIPFTPIMIIIASAIKIEDHGPVFYKQKRVTRDGKVFHLAMSQTLKKSVILAQSGNKTDQIGTKTAFRQTDFRPIIFSDR